MSKITMMTLEFVIFHFSQIMKRNHQSIVDRALAKEGKTI